VPPVVDPPVIIVPEDPPVVKPEFNLKGWLNNRKWWIAGLVALIILFIALKGC
jgi:hypothetical protein